MRLGIDPQLCAGCRICEMECSYAHEKRFGTAISRIRVCKLEEVGIDYPVVCQQCANAPCVAACPEGALRKTEIGSIEVDFSRCKRCGACVKACPFGAMNLHPVTGIPISCDLCGGHPICVAECPTGAIFVEDQVCPSSEQLVELASTAGNRREAFVKKTTRKLMDKWGVS